MIEIYTKEDFSICLIWSQKVLECKFGLVSLIPSSDYDGVKGPFPYWRITSVGF